MPGRLTTPAPHRFLRALNVAAVAAAVMIGLTAVAPSAFAQVAATPAPTPAPAPESEKVITLEAFVVTGLKATLEKGEKVKRESIQSVDAINAEDIGKFPDRSMGEALQRIAGVQVSRRNGEVHEVLVRGLPDLATSLNGNEVFTGNGRRLALQDLPVQALSSIEVFKTSSADQQEGGIAGLLNAQLRGPFDFPGKTASAYFDWRYLDPNGNNGKALQTPNFGAQVSNRWKTKFGEFGALIDAVYLKDSYNNPVQWIDEYRKEWVYAVDAAGNASPTGFDDATQKFIVPAGTRLAHLPFVGGVYAAGDRERPMTHMALAWKPSSTLQFDAQVLYTGYRSRHEDDFFFSFVGANPLATGVMLAPEGPYSQTPFGVISPILTATVPPHPFAPILPFTATSTQAFETKTDTLYASIGMKWHKGNLRWSSDLALVDSAFSSDRIIVDQTLNEVTLRLFTYDKAGHGGFTVTTPTSNTPMRDPSQFTLRGLYQSFDETSGKQLAWRNDFTYRLDNAWLSSLNAGIRVSTHNVANHSAEGGRPEPSSASPVTAFGAGFNTVVPGVDRLGGAFATPSRDFLLDKRDQVRTWYGAAAGRLPEDPNRYFDQDEDIATVYGQAKYDFKLGSIGVKGAAGLRALNTKRTLRGNNSVGAVVTPFTKKTSDTDVLPSLNSIVSWTNKLQSHISFGKTIRRPEFVSLNPATSATPPPNINSPGRASGGNSELKPVESISADATLEYYFEKGGYVQLALFHRDIEGYIENFTTRETINGVAYDVGRPNNSGKAKLKGFEIGGQKFFDFLPAPFADFGIQANYTYITGKNEHRTTLNGNEFVDAGLAGVAKHNYTAALMYEGHGITSRLALVHRDDYIETPRKGFFSLDERVKASNYVDFSLGYQLSKNLTLQFDALNLTKENYESYLGDPISPRDIRYGSRVFILGVRWKL